MSLTGKTGKGGHAARWILSAALLVVAISVLAAVAVPLAVSTELVRDRLESDISRWTGQYVMLGAHPRLALWPVPSITFDHVSILPRDPAENQPLAIAESVTADFSVISALTGSPEFTNFQFNEPVFTVRRARDGSLNWQSDSGRIAAAARVVAANANAAANNKAAADQQPVPDDTLGKITIVNGKIQFSDKVDDDIETVEKLNGTIDWPQLNGGAQIDVSGVFRGEKVHITASSAQPLLLLYGNNAPLDATFDSALLSLSFSGNALLATHPFFNGKLVLDTKSVQKLLQWSGTDIRPGEAIGTLHIDAAVTTQRDRVNLDNLIIDIDDNRGIGVLDIRMPKARFPVVAGTLAFNKLNITSFLKAFTPLPKPGDNIATTIDTRFLRQLGLDLRLSAQSATLGNLALTNLAAAARVDQGRAAFEVGDATIYGGSLTGKVQISEKGLDGGGVIQASARNVDFGAVFDALKLKGPLPRGKGSLDVQIKSAHPLWETSSRDITGSLKLAIQGGTIPSFDINAFRTLSKKQRFFDLNRVASGSLPITSALFQVEFADGLAQVSQGTITTKDSVIDLNGVIPYAQGSLAMAGSLGPRPPPAPAKAASDADKNKAEADAAKAPAAKPPLRFFIGGSWPSPVISPVISQ